MKLEPHIGETQESQDCAFTLSELLVVVAVISILAGLLLPALSSAKSSAKVTACLNHKKQLQLGWLLYAGDNDDQIVPNGEVRQGSLHADLKYWWAQGFMNYDGTHPDNTNTSLLVDPAYARLANYTKRPELYQCAEDNSSVLIDGAIHRRVRGVSMNVHVGRCVDCFTDGLPTHLGPKTIADIPHASMQFVFLDEHPDSIGSTAFWLNPGTGRDAMLVSYPGSLHKGAATLSFADGRAESHRWIDLRTKPPVKGKKYLGERDSPNNPDLVWLQQRTFFPTE